MDREPVTGLVGLGRLGTHRALVNSSCILRSYYELLPLYDGPKA